MSLPPEAFEIQDDMARAPLGGTLSDPDAAGRVAVLADPGEAAQAGLAVLGAFYGGYRHRFRTRLRLGRAGWCRIEVHGNVGRMQKIVAHVAAGGEVLLQAEEVEELQVTRHGDELEIEMIFRAAGSMVEWLYILGRELTPGEGPVLQCRETSLQVLETADPERLRRHQPARVLEGVHIACQAFTVLQGTFTLKLEIHRPGHQLTGLSLESDLPLAHLRWWTWDCAAIAPRGDELQPQHPAHPLRSPALMDVFGASQANQGHAISGIFADWLDMEHMGLSE
ncbi:hypothetical protein SAMN06297129_2697 [Pseudooceanicola antarcticus]|uniref:Uncharacterized protein n=1 Tax=Pseudooceanicola antarcticus TaxID=1247613 RepID=A0A285J0Y8_9RHOB|nr:hypothetical protein [Pseudooceanicola antarcticus]PJE29890.1 hypothetical protein CVM39_08310 [Pseudooceanicola antarcticus]SNY53990.1 hypothetical protein SAMN06297129_2697 [Pseudooceanicola antarcticus]